jgi:hypothetical protein
LPDDQLALIRLASFGHACMVAVGDQGVIYSIGCA